MSLLVSVVFADTPGALVKCRRGRVVRRSDRPPTCRRPARSRSCRARPPPLAVNSTAPFDGGADRDHGLDALVLQHLLEIGLAETCRGRRARDGSSACGATSLITSAVVVLAIRLIDHQWPWRRAHRPSSFFIAGIVARQRGRLPQFWFMKSSISSAVVFGSTVTGLSAGAGGAFTLAHSSTMSAACVGSASAHDQHGQCAAIRLRFMYILSMRVACVASAFAA